ncbi:MAG: hypothetical protein HY834_08895 [Devosia nanyangense]|uniref:Uncharacterized protein n=1 Tax=Devosia nanyangense TaxID=1228055 RepID=A0A933L0R2_9HYPH|nr:hypothetical protein [Devosia nanyangense]
MVRAAFEAGTGIGLPSHADGYSTAADRAEVEAIRAGEAGDWIGVLRGSERAFDCATMRLMGTLHIGIIVERDRLLHVRRGRLSVIEPLGRFAGNGLELFRHRSLGGIGERDRQDERR